MGRIKVHECTTIDGVVDVPMWTMDYTFTPQLAEAIGGLTSSATAILLGRVTFEMFAPAWSTRTVEDDPGAPFFNETRKYVVASGRPAVEWNNSEVLGAYDPAAIHRLKDETEGDIYVSGSATLVRALIADGLLDELHLFVYPVAVGTGIRLFPEGHARTPLRLLGAQGLDNGVAHLTYGLTST